MYIKQHNSRQSVSTWRWSERAHTVYIPLFCLPAWSNMYCAVCCHCLSSSSCRESGGPRTLCVCVCVCACGQSIHWHSFLDGCFTNYDIHFPCIRAENAELLPFIYMQSELDYIGWGNTHICTCIYMYMKTRTCTCTCIQNKQKISSANLEPECFKMLLFCIATYSGMRVLPCKLSGLSIKLSWCGFKFHLKQFIFIVLCWVNCNAYVWSYLREYLHVDIDIHRQHMCIAHQQRKDVSKTPPKTNTQTHTSKSQTKKNRTLDAQIYMYLLVVLSLASISGTGDTEWQLALELPNFEYACGLCSMSSLPTFSPLLPPPPSTRPPACSSGGWPVKSLAFEAASEVELSFEDESFRRRFFRFAGGMGASTDILFCGPSFLSRSLFRGRWDWFVWPVGWGFWLWMWSPGVGRGSVKSLWGGEEEEGKVGKEWGEDCGAVVTVVTVGRGGATVEVGVVACFRKFCFSFFWIWKEQNTLPFTHSRTSTQNLLLAYMYMYM